MGIVEEINARAAVLVTIDGRTVLFPNDEVIAPEADQPLRSWGSSGRDEGSYPGRHDIASVDERVIESLALLPEVLTEPEPAVQITGFDGKHMIVAVQFWSAPDPVSQEVARSGGKGTAGSLRCFGAHVVRGDNRDRRVGLSWRRP